MEARMRTGARAAAWWLGGLAGAGLAVAVGMVVALERARLEPMLVRGESMRPTLVPGQRVAVGPLREPLRRGAVVVLRRPDREGLEVVKRVIGLPGERVRLVGGHLEVDGRRVPEPYLAGAGTARRPTAPRRPTEAAAVALDVLLGEGEYLVLGDHRDASSDSRAFGPVRASDLVGSVRFAYWPPRRLELRVRMPTS
jgi:signal peptidase I